VYQTLVNQLLVNQLFSRSIKSIGRSNTDESTISYQQLTNQPITESTVCASNINILTTGALIIDKKINLFSSTVNIHYLVYNTKLMILNIDFSLKYFIIWKRGNCGMRLETRTAVGNQMPKTIIIFITDRRMLQLTNQNQVFQRAM